MEFGIYYNSLRESLEDGDRRANRIYAEADRAFLRTLTSGYRDGWCPAERELWERIGFLLLDTGMAQHDVMRLTCVSQRSMSHDYIHNTALTTYKHIQRIRETNIWKGYGSIGTSKFGISGGYTVNDMVQFIYDLFVYMVAIS